MPSGGRTGHRIIAFEDWRGGEYGVRDPSLAPMGSFTGLNVCRYDTGLLGPRKGLKKLTLTSAGSIPTGVVWGFGINPTITGVGNKSTWFVIGDKAYLMNADGSSIIQATGSFNTAATKPVYGVPQGNNTYITGPDMTSVYKLDHGAETLTTIAGSPSQSDYITQYGEVLLTTGPFNAIRWSSPSLPTTWPAGNVAAVGPAGSYIMGAINQRDHLIFSKLEGGWWLLRGSLGQSGGIQSAGTATLRKITDTMSVASHDSQAVLQNGNIAFVRGSIAAGVVSAAMIHTGSEVIEAAPYIPWSTGDSSYYDNNRQQVQALRGSDDWIALSRPSLGAGEALIRVNNTWAKFTFDPTGSTYPAIMRSVVPGDTNIFFCDLGAAATEPKFWRWDAYLRRPGFAGDGNAQPGDDSTTPVDAYFTTNEWMSDAGFEARVLKVTVDFRAWTTGSASSNHFDVQVITTKVMNQGNVTNPSVVSSDFAFDDPAGSLGDTGEGVQLTRTWDFNVLEKGRGFKIKLSNIRGVAIERVHVHVDVEEQRI